jgi:hypothetical protein
VLEGSACRAGRPVSTAEDVMMGPPAAQVSAPPIPGVPLSGPLRNTRRSRGEPDRAPPLRASARRPGYALPQAQPS